MSAVQLAHSPAHILAELYWGLNLGVRPPASGWQITINQSVTSPDTLITLFDTAGLMDKRIQRTNEKPGQDGIQVRVRAQTHPVAYKKASDLALALDNVVRTQVLIAAGNGLPQKRYLLHVVRRTTQPIYIGIEEGTPRLLFTVNALVKVTEIPV